MQKNNHITRINIQTLSSKHEKCPPLYETEWISDSPRESAGWVSSASRGGARCQPDWTWLLMSSEPSSPAATWSSESLWEKHDHAPHMKNDCSLLSVCFRVSAANKRINPLGFCRCIFFQRFIITVWKYKILTFMPRPVVRLSPQNSAKKTQNSPCRLSFPIFIQLNVKKIIFEPLCCKPVSKVVISVGHVDQSLDQVGSLNKAEEHLWTNRRANDQHPKPTTDTSCGQFLHSLVAVRWILTSVSRGMCRPLPWSTVDLRDLPGHARLRWLSERPDQEKTSW